MTRRSGWLVLVLCALVSVILTAAGAGAARAENLGPGGGTRIVIGDQVVGPYLLLVTTSPEPAQVGLVTVVVRVSDPY